MKRFFRKMKFLFTAIVVILIGGVTMAFIFQDKVGSYEGGQPKADMKEYFSGPIKAWGIIQDWKGHVIKRFDATLIGSWDGDTGTLEEEFTYYDGTKQSRKWTITKGVDGSFAGAASDIIGEASGKQSGHAILWNYVMDIPVDGTVYRISFDDWMWQMNDGVMINRSYMKKFGFTVAELTVFMQKQPQLQDGN